MGQSCILDLRKGYLIFLVVVFCGRVVLLITRLFNVVFGSLVVAFITYLSKVKWVQEI